MTLHRRLAQVVPALAVALVAGAAGAPASNADVTATNAGVDAKTKYMLSATGYGAEASALEGLLDTGKIGSLHFGCTNKVPVDRSRQVAGLDLEALGEVGAITTHVTASKQGKTVTTTSHTTIADASLLGGEIVIDGLELEVSAWADKTGFHTSAQTTAASIEVAGDVIELGDEPIDITIPGVASIRLNDVVVDEGSNWADVYATALTITLLDGSAGEVVVGYADASVDGRTYKGKVDGGGFAAELELGGVLATGKLAKNAMTCRGTGGVDKVRSLVGLEEGPVQIGAAQVTVNGDAGIPSSTVTSEVADVEIDLAGLAGIALRGVKAVAHAERDGKTYTTSYEGSTIGELVVTTVLGIEVPLDIPVEPNTEINLLGLGTLEFLSVDEIKKGKGIEVTTARISVPALQLELTLGNAQAAVK